MTHFFIYAGVFLAGLILGFIAALFAVRMSLSALKIEVATMPVMHPKLEIHLHPEVESDDADAWKKQ